MWIEAGTVVGNFVWIMYISCASGIWKDFGVFSVCDLLSGLRSAFNIIFGKLIGNVATVTYNIFASKLGTDLYAVHSICYTVAVFIENLIEEDRKFILVRLSGILERNRFNYMSLLLRKCCFRFYIIMLILIPSVTFILKGDISYSNCMKWVFLYCSYNLVLVFSYSGYLLSVRVTRYAVMENVLGTTVRVAVLLPLFYIVGGLLPFTVALLADISVRVIYQYRCSKKEGGIRCGL